MRRQFAFGVGTVLFFSSLLSTVTTRADDLPVQPQRTLVIVIHGTEFTPNTGSWMKVVPGMATFASELQRAMGPGSEIYPFMWSGADTEPARQQAATRLAATIDAIAPNFDRVCLVGHSHGGNVALLAAGICHHGIDSVICLATPHFYLETISRDAVKFLLPVHCTWQARRNIKSIINIFTRFDDVAGFWADVTKGLTIMTARALTGSWEDHLAFQHLGDDMAEYLMGQVAVGIPASLSLNVANVNQPIESLVPGDLIGITRHSDIHSRRMGYVVGELLRDGSTRQRMAYIATIVQPKDADEGECITNEANAAWVATHAKDFQQMGWRLDRVAVRLDPAVKLVAGPNALVSLHESADHTTYVWRSYPSAESKGTLTSTWGTNFILRDGQSGVLGIRSNIAGRNLGEFRITAEGQPPSTLAEDTTNGVYWSADLRWTPVHY